MFGNKKVNEEKIVEEICAKVKEAYEKPLICLFDSDKNIKEILSANQFKFDSASTGACVKVPNNRVNDKHFLRLDYQAPANLHEYEIVIFDTSFEKSIDYKNECFDIESTKTKKVHALLSAFPQKVFDPRPLSMHLISNEIANILQKESIIIQFCTREEMVNYQLVEINHYGTDVTNEWTYSNLVFYDDYPGRDVKTGKKIKLPEEETKLSQLFGKYLAKSRYEMIFYHPKPWVDGTYKKADNFIPLLENENGEIVSFCHFIKKGIIFVFPHIEDKSSFLSELLTVYLPEIAPTLFPFHGQFGWLDSEDYLLPNEKELLTQKLELDKKFKLDIQTIDAELKKNKEQFNFLQLLLWQSGDELVKSVETYLRWLGFDSVRNIDEESPEIREEDLQVETDKGLLVIEIKGIGGTSTDKDCSQISKIRFRRAEQRSKFDVFGLYIVNHQRYIPPNSRLNPPFNENQINDAVLDKRGLLTTFELFNAYFLIKEGILTKEAVRDKLFDIGLIELTPRDLVSVGTPKEYFKNNTIVILNLKGIPIARGDVLIAKKNSNYQKISIESLRLNDKDVEQANDGEVGLKLDRPIKRGSELFKVQV